MNAKKKRFYLFLSICLIWICQPETVCAGGGIYVKGTSILQAPDHTVQCGNGTAQYDPDTNILTLNNAAISQDSAGVPLTYGIEIWEQGVTVELVGQNSIEAHMGISSSAPLCIVGTGGGSLLVNTAARQDLTSISCRGIHVEGGGLTVRDASLRIQVNGFDQKVSGQAIYICGGENLVSHSNIEINMWELFDSAVGINAANAVSLTISDDSSVTMKGVKQGIGMGGTGGGRLVISGSRLAIEEAGQSAVSCNNLEILNGSDVTATSATGLALGVDERITISGSVVNAESKGSNGILCNELAVTDSSKVTAKGYWPAFFVVKDTVIADSSIEAESQADVGIFGKDGNLEINSSEVRSTSDHANMGGILVNGNLTMNESNVTSPGADGVSGIRARGDITVTGGRTEIGNGNISSGNNVHIGGIITSNGKPSYENIESSNANGQVTFLDADYRTVDEAIAKAEALKKADYANFDIVEAAINAVVRGKNIREQDIVDGYAAAIEAAIAALKPLSVITIIEGADQTVVVGKNKGVIIKADGDFDKFVGVSVDGSEIAEKDYTAAAGSTIITLKPEYIKTLAAGEHTVEIRFTDGLARTTLTVRREGTGNPTEKPGDGSTEKPGDDPAEKPDTPSDGTEQKPSQTPPQTTPGNPAVQPSQGQEPVKKSPATGDNAPTPVGWLVILAGASAAVLAVGTCSRQ